MSFVLKTAAGEWLQDQATGKDFFFPTKALSSTKVDVAPEVLLRQGQSQSKDPGQGQHQGQRENKGQAAAAMTSPICVPVDKPASPPSKPLTQSERNRAELPDITKGVPWLPHQVVTG